MAKIKDIVFDCENAPQLVRSLDDRDLALEDREEVGLGIAFAEQTSPGCVRRRTP
jgi:hypothetical protein